MDTPVTTDAGTEGGDALARATVRRWRDSLVNLTRANRLLDLRAAGSGTVRVTAPGGAALLDALHTLRQAELAERAGADEFGEPAGAPQPRRVA